MSKRSTTKKPTTEATTEPEIQTATANPEATPESETDVTMIRSISEMQNLMKEPVEILVCRGQRRVRVQPLDSMRYTQSRIPVALTPPADPHTGQPNVDDPEFKRLLKDGDIMNMVTTLEAGLPDIMIPGSTPQAKADWITRNWTDRDVEELRFAIKTLSVAALGRFDPEAAEKEHEQEDEGEDEGAIETEDETDTNESANEAPPLITSAEDLCLSTTEIYTAIAVLPDGSKVGWRIKPLPQELSRLADALNSVSIPRIGKGRKLDMNDLNYRRKRAQAALAFKGFLAWFGLHEFDWEGTEPHIAPRMKPEDAATAIGEISSKLHKCVPRIVDFVTGEISNASQADLDVMETATFY